MRRAVFGRWGWAVVWLLFLAGCRYTFLPLDPGRPQAAGTWVVGKALPDRAVLEVVRLEHPGYLHLRVYQGEALVREEAVFLEGPRVLEVAWPEEGYTRLVVLFEGAVLLQLDRGAPALPDPQGQEDQGQG
ncbi:hypothetical protein [Thermus filiformis]|uniref:hypothetical protein n=1 Tax=Thermus filiformis TaxID=276 RepID=UPI00146FDCD9|nr:hypothetical protein [Thermus filiformis]